jgi:hypothetical protein
MVMWQSNGDGSCYRRGDGLRIELGHDGWHARHLGDDMLRAADGRVRRWRTSQSAMACLNREFRLPPPALPDPLVVRVRDLRGLLTP